jgi:hypothetical protein
MGHALRLGDIIPRDGICSEVQDMLYQDPTARYGCGVVKPTSCDTTGLDNVYPVAVGYCPAEMNNTCNGTPCT